MAKAEEKDEYRRMRSRWGKRRGWELQRLLLGRERRVFWRLASRNGGCRPATEVEIRLWRQLPEEDRRG